MWYGFATIDAKGRLVSSENFDDEHNPVGGDAFTCFVMRVRVYNDGTIQLMQGNLEPVDNVVKLVNQGEIGGPSCLGWTPLSMTVNLVQGGESNDYLTNKLGKAAVLNGNWTVIGVDDENYVNTVKDVSSENRKCLEDTERSGCDQLRDDWEHAHRYYIDFIIAPLKNLVGQWEIKTTCKESRIFDVAGKSYDDLVSDKGFTECRWMFIDRLKFDQVPGVYVVILNKSRFGANRGLVYYALIGQKEGAQIKHVDAENIEDLREWNDLAVPRILGCDPCEPGDYVCSIGSALADYYKFKGKGTPHYYGGESPEYLCGYASPAEHPDVSLLNVDPGANPQEVANLLDNPGNDIWAMPDPQLVNESVESIQSKIDYYLIKDVKPKMVSTPQEGVTYVCTDSPFGFCYYPCEEPYCCCPDYKGDASECTTTCSDLGRDINWSWNPFSILDSGYYPFLGIYPANSSAYPITEAWRKGYGKGVEVTDSVDASVTLTFSDYPSGPQSNCNRGGTFPDTHYNEELDKCSRPQHSKDIGGAGRKPHNPCGELISFDQSTLEPTPDQCFEDEIKYFRQFSAGMEWANIFKLTPEAHDMDLQRCTSKKTCSELCMVGYSGYSCTTDKCDLLDDVVCGGCYWIGSGCSNCVSSSGKIEACSDYGSHGYACSHDTCGVGPCFYDGSSCRESINTADCLGIGSESTCVATSSLGDNREPGGCYWNKDDNNCQSCLTPQGNKYMSRCMNYADREQCEKNVCGVSGVKDGCYWVNNPGPLTYQCAPCAQSTTCVQYDSSQSCLEDSCGVGPCGWGRVDTGSGVETGCFSKVPNQCGAMDTSLSNAEYSCESLSGLTPGGCVYTGSGCNWCWGTDVRVAQCSDYNDYPGLTMYSFIAKTCVEDPCKIGPCFYDDSEMKCKEAIDLELEDSTTWARTSGDAANEQGGGPIWIHAAGGGMIPGDWEAGSPIVQKNRYSERGTELGSNCSFSMPYYGGVPDAYEPGAIWFETLKVPNQGKFVGKDETKCDLAMTCSYNVSDTNTERICAEFPGLNPDGSSLHGPELPVSHADSWFTLWPFFNCTANGDPPSSYTCILREYKNNLAIKTFSLAMYEPITNFSAMFKILQECPNNPDCANNMRNNANPIELPAPESCGRLCRKNPAELEHPIGYPWNLEEESGGGIKWNLGPVTAMNIEVEETLPTGGPIETSYRTESIKDGIWYGGLYNYPLTIHNIGNEIPAPSGPWNYIEAYNQEHTLNMSTTSFQVTALYNATNTMFREVFVERCMWIGCILWPYRFILDFSGPTQIQANSVRYACVGTWFKDACDHWASEPWPVPGLGGPHPNAVLSSASLGDLNLEGWESFKETATVESAPYGDDITPNRPLGEKNADMEVEVLGFVDMLQGKQVIGHYTSAAVQVRVGNGIVNGFKITIPNEAEIDVTATDWPAAHELFREYGLEDTTEIEIDEATRNLLNTAYTSYTLVTPLKKYYIYSDQYRAKGLDYSWFDIEYSGGGWASLWGLIAGSKLIGMDRNYREDEPYYFDYVGFHPMDREVPGDRRVIAGLLPETSGMVQGLYEAVEVTPIQGDGAGSNALGLSVSQIAPPTIYKSLYYDPVQEAYTLEFFSETIDPSNLAAASIEVYTPLRSISFPLVKCDVEDSSIPADEKEDLGTVYRCVKNREPSNVFSGSVSTSLVSSDVRESSDVVVRSGGSGSQIVPSTVQVGEDLVIQLPSAPGGTFDVSITPYSAFNKEKASPGSTVTVPGTNITNRGVIRVEVAYSGYRTADCFTRGGSSCGMQPDYTAVEVKVTGTTAVDWVFEHFMVVVIALIILVGYRLFLPGRLDFYNIWNEIKGKTK